MAELMQPGLMQPGLMPAAGVQLAAVAWLRWRMFVNGLRTGKSGTRSAGGIVLAVVLRMLLWPIFAVWILGPVALSGYVGWSAIANHQPTWLLALMTGIGFLWQFIGVSGSNIAAAMPTFDPASLLRFPLPFGRYLLLRLFLGLLTPSTVVGCLALLSAAVGVGVARPELLPVAVAGFGLYALANVFCARMIGIWLDRVLARRRGREIFGGLLAIVVVSFQFVQFGRVRHVHMPRGHVPGSEQQSWIIATALRSAHAMHWLPPGFAADSVLHSASLAAVAGNLVLLAAWAALFLAGFGVRLHRQFLGEYLSDSLAPAARRSTAARRAPVRPVPQQQAMRSRFPLLPALLRKEWLTLRSNSGQLMGLLTPPIFVWIVSRGSFGSHPDYLLSGAVAYAILGPMSAAYNVFGPEGPGVQLYLLAPLRLRDVVLAKNIASGMILMAEAALAWVIAVSASKTAIAPATQVATALWLIFVLLANLTVGTMRSIQSPRKFAPGQSNQMRSAPTGRTSALLAVALVLGSLLLQVPVIRIGRHLHEPWLGVWVFGALAAAGAAGYVMLLMHVDAMMLRNRDVLERELCGV